MNATLSQGFAQDALHRVTTDAGSYGTKNYTYDGAGNRLTRTHGASSQTLTYATVSPPPGGGGSGGWPATGSPGTGGATLAVSSTQVLPSGSVTATLTSGLGGSTDWLALAAVGAPTGSYLQWRYVGSGVTTLNWTVTMPATTGAYEFRLFLNNGYTLAARSPAVTVSATPAESVPWANGSNRLATHDGNTVTLDAAGSTLGDPAESLTFTYGSHQRMLEAYGGGVLKASYVYDGRGQRIKKIEATSPNRTIVYHYGPAGELLGETIYSSAGAKIGERDYLWLDTLPLAQSERTFSGGTITGSTFVYLHADQLNTPRLATNASGTVVWRWDSDAFGIGAANQDPDGDTNLVNIRLRFPGQYLDEETGLHYNYYRDYDAVTGRYVQSDPVGLFGGGVNTYSYARANPSRWTDIYGLQVPDCEFWVTSVERRSSIESEREVWGHLYRLVGGQPDGVSVTENLDPLRPKQAPIKPAVRIQVSVGKFEYGQERTILVEQVVEHLKAFCTTVINTCAGEEKVVMEPFDTQRRHPEIRTEIGSRFYQSLVAAFGLYVDVGLP